MIYSNVSDATPAPAVAKSDLPYPVVGIGASAGGIVALQRFFERLDAPCGMAFVVILHLSPKHESHVAEILQRVTALRVTQVNERMALEADHVYVIPPDKDLDMDDGHLSIREPTRTGGPQVVIDLFLRTLAEAHTDRAFAIVLSGLGSDGALGVQRINEYGGVVMAQSPEDAEYDSMPRAAIATGLVDFVMPVAEMPDRLVAMWKNLQRMRLPVGAAIQHSVEPPTEPGGQQVAEEALRDTLRLLHTRTRHDFRRYKRATVLRRLERRLQVNALPDLPAYREFLELHPTETPALLQDMLISVTRFFRDREAFDALATTVIPALFANRGSEDVVRVWIAACASGEEAYTVAMLLREHAETLDSPPQVQIFATDIDERAVAVGRSGVYPEGIANDLTPARLHRFFHKEGDRYRVVKALRESVLFAVHNVLSDPPFSRLDLIACRNLLIYLDGDAQKAVLETGRFALHAGGFLFLGSTESADAPGSGFRIVDKQHRIYENDATATVRRTTPVPKLVMDRGAPPPAEPRSTQTRRDAANVDLHRWALEQFAPPSVLIDGNGQILHMSPGAAAFFVRSSGTPTHDLVANTQPELRIEMSTAVFRAQQVREPVTIHASMATTDGVARRVAIGVQPFRDADDADYALVTLQDLREAMLPSTSAVSPSTDKGTHEQLEAEVVQLKGYLRDTIEQSDATNSELKASNEELQAINEEMRSASEELETGKEELQALNEELATVNVELKVKVDETVQVNDDLQNLIASTDIAVLFVDAQMRIKRFTPRATELFNLIAGDVGRSLLDITHQLHADDVTADAQEAFRTLRAIEREATDQNGRHYLSRVIPYRTADHKIAGAVMTFVDITSRVLAEHQVRENEERLRIAAESVRHYAIITLDEEGIVRTWNAGAHDAFGYEEKEVVGRSIELLFTPEDRAARVHEQELATARATGSAEDERWHLRKDGTRFYCSGVMTSYMTGGTLGFAKIGRDMTGTRLLQARRDEELSRQKQAGLAAEAANRLKDEFLAVMSHELKHPLNLIHVNAELLARMPQVDQFPAVRRAAETIRRTVSGQARIIDDLLDLSRARTGKMMMTLVRTSLRDIVTRITDAAKGDAGTKQVVLERVIDPDDDLVLSCDPVRIEQIVWNLLSNAVKFTETGGKVTISLVRDRSEVRLDITDTGRGIAPAFLPNVFSMFRQERRETIHGEGGMGIGLALVKELTEAQGGRVAVRSAGVGRGATFSVIFPIDDDPMTGSLPVERPAGDEPLHGLRILVIDDAAEALEPFAELLRLEGAEVVEGHSGAAALELLDKHTFDLLVSDVGMPAMDGYQLIDAVRKRNTSKDLVAIAMTGFGRANDVQRATDAGFDAHLTKPASIDDCKRAVAALRESGRLD